MGLIACADMEESVFMSGNDSEFLDVDFDELYIDEAKGALFFRLAENVTAIIVDEKVADIVEEENIPGIGSCNISMVLNLTV